MLTLPDNEKQLVDMFLQLRTDPYGLFHNHTMDDFLGQVNYKKLPKIIAVLDGSEETQEETILKNDKILENFVLGTEGIVGRMDIVDKTPTSVPIVLRGITKRKVMRHCEETGRDYYYVDTGYFGNEKKKDYHRVTKNAMQYFGEIVEHCPDDRFNRTRTALKPHVPGNDILICPPSEKAMKYWGLDLQEWLANTVAEVKKHTNRQIVIREKASRSVRVNIDTMEMALAKNVHCMITFNSIAAIESLINGKPVFTMGPNAAQRFANTDLSKIENPFMPQIDQIRMLMCNLAYQQFTVEEMRNGTAWRMLQEWPINPPAKKTKKKK